MTETYKRIIKSISKKKKPQRELTRRTLMWIAYAKIPLSFEELRDAVAMEANIEDVKMLWSKIPPE